MLAASPLATSPLAAPDAAAAGAPPGMCLPTGVGIPIYAAAGAIADYQSRATIPAYTSLAKVPSC